MHAALLILVAAVGLLSAWAAWAMLRDAVRSIDEGTDMGHNPSDAYWEALGRGRPPELAVRCPWCKAQPLERCSSPDRTLRGFHPSRTDAAR